MVRGNCSLPFSFYCITDDPSNLDKEITILHADVDLQLESWWWKMLLFSDTLPPNIPTLYLDIEVVVQNNLDSIIKNIVDDKILTIRLSDSGSLATVDKLKYPTFINSSILGFISGQHKIIYDKFVGNIDYNILEYFGMDRFISRYFLDRLNFLSFPNQYYFRHGNNKPIDQYKDKYGFVHVPDSTICVIKQIKYLPDPDNAYKGLEDYFL